MPLTSALRAPARVPFLQAAKAAIATVAAWLIASAIFTDRIPVFAAIAALLVVQPSVNQSLGKAIERSLGVIVGVLVATGVTFAFGNAGWIVLLAIVLAIAVGWALRLTPGTANQVPISAILVLSIGTMSSDYAIDRIIETMIGAAIAIIVNLLIVPPVLVVPAAHAVWALAEEIAATLQRLADALLVPQSPAQLEELLLTARLLRPMHQKTADTLKEAADSLTFNPRSGKHKRVLARNEELFQRMSPLVTRTLGMTRAVRDRYDDTLVEEPTVHAIAEELSRASHDLIAQASATTDPTPAPVRVDEPAALTAPLTIAVPHPEHWVLLGSLLEDLRRIHEEIAGD